MVLHSVSVCTLMIAFGRNPPGSGRGLASGGIGGLLRRGQDRGADEVLNKPGRLTDAEFALIRAPPRGRQLYAILLERRPRVGPVPLDIAAPP